MAVVKLEPTDEYPVPYDGRADTTKTNIDELNVLANTGELLEALGAGIPEMDGATLLKEKELLEASLRSKGKPQINTLPAALGAAAFLREYGTALATGYAEVRTALTNKLLELADHDDPKISLKAIELLGKHSDVGLFTERSEITVKHEKPESLEAAIIERVKRIMHAEVVDKTPLGMNLDEELSLPQVVDAEFTEINSDE